MARGRFISKSAVTNYRLNGLPLEADFMFWRMTILADPNGCIQGKAKLVNKMVWPLRDFSDRQVESWLKLLEESKDDETGLGLIERYEVKGHEFIWLPGFEKHQIGLHKDREAKSSIPLPPPELMEKARQWVVQARGKGEEKTNAEIKTDDLKVAGMIKFYEEQLGRMVSPNDLVRLADFADNYPDGWFEKAVNEAKINEARSPMRYIEKIMESWREKEQPVEASGNQQGMESI